MKIQSSYKTTVLILGLTATGLIHTGCKTLECAEGTREQDGKCVALNQVSGDDAGVQCGGNTILVGNQCVPLAEALCGPNTSVVPILDASGFPTDEFYCEGQAGDDQPDPCPEVGTDGLICVNGWVRWFIDEGGSVLESSYREPGATTDTATRLLVMVYDPLAYATDPVNTQPLSIAEVNPMTGTFTATGIAVPVLGYIALVVDEADPGDEDIVAFTGYPYAAGTQNMEGMFAAVITNLQVEAWTAYIEEAGGGGVLEGLGCIPPAEGEHSLLTCGTWIGVYMDGSQDEPGNAVEGVVPHMGPPVIDPARTFYLGYTSADGVVFDDTAAGAVWSDGDGPYEYTGTKGVVFYPSATLHTQYRGDCAADTQCDVQGCDFNPNVTGGAATNAMFVQPMFPALVCGDAQ